MKKIAINLISILLCTLAIIITWFFDEYKLIGEVCIIIICIISFLRGDSDRVNNE